MNNTTSKQGTVLYCLDDLRYFLTPQNILDTALCIIQILPKAYKQIDPQSGAVSVFVTREELKEVLSCLSASEAKALEYVVTHGAMIGLAGDGEVVIDARDVAICFGYAKPNKAIRKYCKSVKDGFIPKTDFAMLAMHSGLPNARQIAAWIASGMDTYNSMKESN